MELRKEHISAGLTALPQFMCAVEEQRIAIHKKTKIDRFYS
jgi:hypothetical protein